MHHSAECAQLEWLSLQYCEKVGDAGVAAVGKGCPLLQYLVLQYCNASKEAVAAVKAQLPQCEVKG